MILFGERALRRVLNEYVAHYHFERNHQGIGNNLVLADVDTQGYRKSSGPWTDPAVRQKS